MDTAPGRLPLFTYGTLLDPDVFRIVSGRDPECLAAEPACLHGHRAAPVRGRPWPTLIPAEGAVHGLVYYDLPLETLARIVFFEGDVYRLERRSVTAAGRPVQAAVFLADPDRAAPGVWDLGTWRRMVKPHALASIRLLMQAFGRNPSDLDVSWPVRA